MVIPHPKDWTHTVRKADLVEAQIRMQILEAVFDDDTDELERLNNELVFLQNNRSTY